MMSQPASACTIAWLAQDFDRLVVDDIVIADQSVLAVATVRVECDVANHAQIVTHFLLDRLDGSADQILGVHRFTCIVRFQTRIGRRKNSDRR